MYALRDTACLHSRDIARIQYTVTLYTCACGDQGRATGRAPAINDAMCFFVQVRVRRHVCAARFTMF